MILGATASSYTLKSDDVRKSITTRALFTDNDGYAESVISDASAPIKASPAGFLLLAYATTGTTYFAQYDKTRTTEPTWNEYFSQTLNVASLDYKYGAAATYGQITASAPAKIIELFDFNWILKLFASNASFADDTVKLQFEILDAANNTLAAIKIEKETAFKNGLWYGASLTGMTKAAQTGEYPNTNGELSFTKSGITYTSLSGATGNSSFYFGVNLTNAVKVRVLGSATATNTVLNTGSAGVYIRIKS